METQPFQALRDCSILPVCSVLGFIPCCIAVMAEGCLAGVCQYHLDYYCPEFLSQGPQLLSWWTAETLLQLGGYFFFKSII